MIGKPGFWQIFNENLLHKQRVAAAIAVSLVLGLQCLDLHASLLFRSVEQVNGQTRLSPLKNYGNPSDTAYARGAATEEVRVFLSGEITQADLQAAAVMEGLLASGRQKIAGNAVWLASSGGDIDAGMDLGRRLRRLGLFTLVGKNDQCLSACVFAFMGGERRSVEGRLGIHRPYFPFTESTDRQAKFRHLQQTLKAYIAEMDFPDSLYEAVMLVPPESMQILTAADLKRFYLEGISPSTEDMVDATAARRYNLSMVEYLKRKAKMPACAFLDAGGGRCEGKVLASNLGGAADTSVQTGTGTATGRAESTTSSGLPVQMRKPNAVDSRGPI